MPKGISGGLLWGSAIAQGLQSGLESYRDEKRYQDKKAREERLTALDARSKGLLYDPARASTSDDEGNAYDEFGFSQSPLGRAKEQSGLLEAQASGLKAQQEIDFAKESTDPNSTLTRGAQAQGAVIAQALRKSPTFKNDPAKLSDLENIFTKGTHAQINKLLGEPGMKETLSTILGQDKLAATIAAVNSKQNERNNVSDKQADAISDFDNTISVAEGLLEDYRDGYTGPIAQYKSGLIGKQFSDPETVAYQGRIGRLLDAYRKAVTGAGAADKELARIESRLPQASDPPNVFKAKAQAFITEVKAARERYLGNLQKKGKRVDNFKKEDAPKGLIPQAPKTEAPPSATSLIDAAKAELQRRGVK